MEPWPTKETTPSGREPQLPAVVTLMPGAIGNPFGAELMSNRGERRSSRLRLARYVKLSKMNPVVFDGDRGKARYYERRSSVASGSRNR